ncbi:MAG: asparagine synthase (glutamine-hydrolyzing) [Saprospiraceae bacterium]|nr:asparagine synthase (glutamine-hydrolyzing) [Saprospiraceae bacterium]
MCGISGIINLKNKEIEPSLIKSINDLIIHRGPDDEGFYFGSNFALGHRRLSIIDLSIKGHQPMNFLDKYIITYNGEVYNYIELREELKNLGYSFFSDSDTEVILASYDMWGNECVTRFNGMWAFVIFDKSKNILFCSRDRFGVKPLYYSQLNDYFIIGSEIKQLLEFHKKKIVNKKILIDFLVTGALEHTNETFFEGIYKLDQGHNLIYDLSSHNFDIFRFYNFSTDINLKKKSLEDSVSVYEIELNRSVDIRLRSDVLIGTCLSGGLDSSLVSTIAAEKYRKISKHKFKAIHAKSSEESTDESYYAKLVTEHSGLDLEIIEPAIDDFISCIDEVVYTQEEPFGGPAIFMQYFIMKRAKDSGCKVMLDGQGGDETQLGYEKYYPAYYRYILKSSGFVKFLKAISDSVRNNSKMNIYWILKFSIGTISATLRKHAYKRRTSFLKTFDNEFSFLNDFAHSNKDIGELQKLEINRTMIPELLRYEDKNSMRHSVETRLPFLDYKAVEAAISINHEFKIKNGWTKFILRKISEKYLPSIVVWRKNKLSFNSPTTTWMSAIDEQLKSEIEASAILNKIADMKKLLCNLDKINIIVKWRLFNIAVWEKVYDVIIE